MLRSYRDFGLFLTRFKPLLFTCTYTATIRGIALLGDHVTLPHDFSCFSCRWPSGVATSDFKGQQEYSGDLALTPADQEAIYRP